MILSKVKATGVWTSEGASRASSFFENDDDERRAEEFDESLDDDNIRILLTYQPLNEQEALQHGYRVVRKVFCQEGVSGEI